jgi:hypothetical protein
MPASELGSRKFVNGTSVRLVATYAFEPIMNATSKTLTTRLSSERASAFETLIMKTRRNIADMVKQPTTWSWNADGDYSKWQEGFFEIVNWTNSFFTGMALIAWNETEDEQFIRALLELEPLHQAHPRRFY